MAKHLEALKSFDEFRAPWETEGGTDAEIDKPKLKRYIYNLATDKAKAQDAREEALDSVKTLEASLEEAKAQAESSNGEEATKKIAKLEKQLAEATEKADKLEKDKEISDLRSEVLEGVDPKHAKHVKGETREELEKSLKEIREDFGIPEPGDGDDGDGDDGDLPARTRPRSNLRNPADPDPKRGTDEIDFDKVADQIIGAGNPFG